MRSCTECYSFLILSGQCLNQPGIVTLEQMFETTEKVVYLVSCSGIILYLCIVDLRCHGEDARRHVGDDIE